VLTPDTGHLSLLLVCLLLLSGCALRPAGEKELREQAEERGRAWGERVEPTPLPERPTAMECLRHAFLANAGLQRAYWEWRAAVEQVPQDSSWPRAMLSFNTLFSEGNAKLWDRTTVGLSNDPMTSIPWPGKLSTAGRRALEQARAAGARFAQAKFDLQGRVLTAYAELALLGESIRVREEELALLRLSIAQASTRAETAAAGRQEMLKYENALDIAQNELSNLRAQVPAGVARFNALLGRPAGAAFALPESQPAARALPAEDAPLLKAAADRSPELAALAHETAARREVLALAKLAWMPDFSLSAGITGSVSQMIGAGVALPTQVEAIRAGIAQAEAAIQSAELARKQSERDLAAGVIVNLYALRNAERQRALFEETLVPRAQQIVALTQAAYASGRAPFGEIIEAQRALLGLRLALAGLRAEREKSLVAIETLAAVDVEAVRER
jgi:outer membrane protein TolC